MAGKVEYDHRKYPRLDVVLPLAYRPVASSEEDIAYNETRTLGLGGLMFEGEKPLPEGSKYYFRFTLQERTLEFIGRVVYILQVDTDLYRMGVEFTNISSEDRDFLLANHLRMKYDINLDEP